MQPNSRIIPPPTRDQPNPNRLQSPLPPPNLTLQPSKSSKKFLSRFLHQPTGRQSRKSSLSAAPPSPIPSPTSSIPQRTSKPHPRPYKTENPPPPSRTNSAITDQEFQKKLSPIDYRSSFDPSVGRPSLKKSSQKGTIKGFGKLFKKLGISSEDPLSIDNIPHVRPIPTNDKASHRRNHPYNIPLAPPPTQESIKRAQDSARLRTETFLGNLPNEFLAQPPRHRTLSDTASRNPRVPPLTIKSTLSTDSNRFNDRLVKQHRYALSSTALDSMAQQPPPQFPAPVRPPRAHRPIAPITLPPKPVVEISTATTIAGFENLPVLKKPVETPEKDYQASQEDQPSPSSWSNLSIGKSSGSYSFYSTFGADSTHSVDSIDTPQPIDPAIRNFMSLDYPFNPNIDPTFHDSNVIENNDLDASSIDSFNTVESALDENPHMDVICEESSLHEGSQDNSATSTDTEDDDDDEVFLNAVDTLEGEERPAAKTPKLSNRLSGGHFGSAGGLILSTAAVVPPVPPLPPHQKRKSQPPPEDIAQAMLEWKRLSDGGVPKRMSTTNQAMGLLELPNQLNDLKAKEESEEELSGIDRQTLRKQAVDALEGLGAGTHTGAGAALRPCCSPSSPPLPPPSAPLPPVPTLPLVVHPYHKPTNSISSLSEMISKTLDSAWSDTVPDIVEVKDPRLSSQVKGAENQTSRPSIQLSESVYTTQNPQEAAKWLWAETEEFVPRERVAEWLGQREPLHAETLVVYMDYFYFAGMRLDNAFRKLCSKLYFKAEAQQIDRILEAFANRFWVCNTRSVFGSADVVYAIVYSLLLLNTDLHVAQGNHNRMTRQEFVRNTMSAIHDQHPEDNAQGRSSKDYTFSKGWEVEIESQLKELYTSVKQYQVLQPNSRHSSQSVVQLEKQNSLLGGRHAIGIKRSVHSMIRKTPRESVSDEIQPRKSTSSGPRFTAPRSTRRESFSSVASGTSYGSNGRGIPLSPYQSIAGHQLRGSTHGAGQLDVPLNQAPYLKEGVVIRKHLLENAQQRAKHREWKECFLVVGQGELKMYALQGTGEPDRKSMFRPSSIHFGMSEANSSQLSLSSMSQNSQRWVSNTQLVGTIQLNHTLSNVLPPPGYNRQRPHVFAIQKPDGGVFLYQASSAEQANEWVATCNYWAARKSKEPLAGGVSNMEYGWGDCLDSVLLDLDTECGMVISPTQPITNEDDLVLYDWHPPVPPSVSSTLSERDQFESLKKHLAALNLEINNHHDTKTKLMIKFPPKSFHHAKALFNWESRSKYLLHDIIKYQNYCDMLEKSIQRQDAEATKAASIMTCATNPDGTTPEPTSSPSSSSKLVFKTSTVDLMKEIGEELQLAF
ncbi:hypothetical protein CLU79DRAFT_754052 [Phycomyces nitens]|nr:hypothetical protein CLU79DRAFT_754052 [Phycomyces nitens]